MKTILSIIAAFALLVAFSMPAMADDNNTATNNDGSAVAQHDSIAINVKDSLNDNRKYDDDNNAVAEAYLEQWNWIENVNEELIDGHSGDINVSGSIRDFSGIANVNLNTGAMNNQAIQQTIAVSVNSGSSQIGD
ncbi:MAG: hypothetical protein M1610_07640 [Nitrospirae bacterium]|nr:hypothetical protein [Nitrospirota bacterium]MDA8338641.1 hypothetical protein [Nitrospiraceae bacterium]